MGQKGELKGDRGEAWGKGGKPRRGRRWQDLDAASNKHRRPARKPIISLKAEQHILRKQELDEENRGKDGRAERGSLWQRLDQCDDTRLTRGDCKEVCLFFKRKIDLILNLTQLCYQQTPHMFRVSRKAITKQMAPWQLFAYFSHFPIFHLISNKNINISIF